MLNILIVDDEFLIRDGLARMIAKESDRFVVTGNCANGQEALEFIAGHAVDAVITDIRMPEIDGLALIRELRATDPRIRCILMSGFTEFSYAKEAIRYAAVDYLLKPIDKEQLFELLYRLDEEKRRLGEQEKRLRLRILDSYLHSEAPVHSLPSELTLPHPCFVVYVRKVSGGETVRPETDDGAGFEDAADCLPVNERVQIWIRYFAEAPDSPAILKGCEPLLTTGCGQAVHIGASRPRTEISELRTAYAEAEQACGGGIYEDSSRFAAIWSGTLPEDHFQTETGSADWPRLRDGLQLLNRDRVAGWIREEFAGLKCRKALPQEILQTCRTILDTAAQEVQEFDSVLGRMERDALERSIAASLKFAEMEELLVSAVSSALEEVSRTRLAMGGKAVEDVKRWICANYNQHAELSALASMVYLTPSYLSKLFKQETGLTLTEFITDVRIKKAKQLLRSASNMKVHSIGAEVGYPDPAYFNKIFKRIVGVTPNEYKKMLH